MNTKHVIRNISLLLLAIMLLPGCGKLQTQPADPRPTRPPTTTAQEAPPTTAKETPQVKHTTPVKPDNDALMADVLSVSVSGASGAYNFSVQIASPDLGCQQYADWWEVIDENGKLLYRRILAHSHVSEQPFTRSGGPVPVDGETVVWVRAHMNPGGYGGAAVKGTANAGFAPAELSPDFAADLAETPPLPKGCAF